MDDRYASDHIVSHSEMKMPSQVVKCSQEILQHVDDRTEVVGIDEGQFFDAGLVAVANGLADRGVRVIVAGLDQDYMGRPFEPMPQILAVAEYVDKILAICMQCGAPANRTQRLTSSTDRVVVGGAEEYEARCRRCFQPMIQMVAAAAWHRPFRNVTGRTPAAGHPTWTRPPNMLVFSRCDRRR